ncbi:hypothetical protein [Paraburkholderia bryophila]|uniref:Integrase n=1 Tax=Paraburkholderia bryophila TaxID=420952 RepID=A0A329B932_9BURK|nr:hypothetical protein [Paraburkholderia bryophila]RAS17031.1 hypothetical protein BX591_1504 [Paraburkholderia bryophila]
MVSDKEATHRQPIFTERDVSIYDIPLGAATILRTDTAILRFDRDTLDVGALCYLRRSSAPRRGRNNGRTTSRQVDLSSFDAERATQVSRLISFFSDLITSGGYRAQTVRANVICMIKYMDWADATGHAHALADGDHAYAAFRGYVGYLRERVNRHEVVPASAAKEQWMVHKLLAGFTGLHDLHRGVRMLQLGAGWSRTEPPSESELAKVESLCEALFLGFSGLVLGGKKYPLKLAMPKYLGWQDNYLWVFPVRRWCLPPHQWKIRHELTLPYWAYNYQDGRLAEPKEIRHHYRDAYTSRMIVGNAQTVIDEANADPRHSHRFKSAMVAHNAFVLLFLGQTGMNFSIASSLKWSKDYIIGQEQQGFREIKWRANGKRYSAVARMNFLPLFKRYIDLRTYLLGEQDCDSLFLSFGANRTGGASSMEDAALDSIYGTLEIIDPKIKRIRARKLRAAKQDFHIRNSEPATSALVMGHSEETALQHYSAGSQSAHHDEVSAFFDRVQQVAAKCSVILQRGESLPNGVVGHVGTCAAFHDPQAVAAIVPVQPDCRQLEGCLFCDKHRVHPDEQDVRKLASCAYVLRQAIGIPGAETSFKPVLDRIQSLLDDIGALEGNAGMVSRVVSEVELDGELDDYWARKLALLNDLEIGL